MKKATANALDILDRRHPPTAADLEQRKVFREQLEIAEMIHQAREEAGLSQRQLADRVGTTASVICRLEDGDYDGHSMAMLRRVADALGKRVQVRFVAASRGETNALVGQSRRVRG
jgi:ribosome-binding protein aMBF1 (putative translation factor)